jgi:putative transposase
LRWGVEPICTQLSELGVPIAPSTYYDQVNREPSRRQSRDEALKAEIARVHAANYGVYGARKVWLALNREGIGVARCTVERLMAELGLSGAVRGKPRRTTIADPAAARPADLVQRQFGPPAPNRLWVADLTYVSTWSGFAYVAFVVDAYARRILGWRVASTMATSMVLDAIEQAIWTRQQEGVMDLKDVVHHTDRGSQTRFNRSTQHLDDGGAFDGTTTRLGGSVDGTGGDVVTGSASGTSGSRTRILGADRGWAHQRGRGARVRRVGSGGNAVVPTRWRNAADRAGPGVGEIPVLHRTRGHRRHASGGSQYASDRDQAEKVTIDDISGTSPQRRHPGREARVPGVDGAVEG